MYRQLEIFIHSRSTLSSIILYTHFTYLEVTLSFQVKHTESKTGMCFRLLPLHTFNYIHECIRVIFTYEYLMRKVPTQRERTLHTHVQCILDTNKYTFV